MLYTKGLMTEIRNKSEEENEFFYLLIRQMLQSLKPRDIIIILGEYNAKVGNRRCVK